MVCHTASLITKNGCRYPVPDTRRNWHYTVWRSWRIKGSSNLLRLPKENREMPRMRYEHSNNLPSHVQCCFPPSPPLVLIVDPGSQERETWSATLRHGSRGPQVSSRISWYVLRTSCLWHHDPLTNVSDIRTEERGTGAGSRPTRGRACAVSSR
jgi:hypothetical protein